MKQISTGTGLCVLGLGIAVLGAAQLVGSKGGQAFAQTGSERRIVSASVIMGNTSSCWGYRIWSDNVIEMKCMGYKPIETTVGGSYINYLPLLSNSAFANWTQVDNGLTAFVPTDVDASQTVDASDLGNVLLNYGETQNGNPPPPIDCTINAPR
jgi:hypothetical protein